MRYLHLSLIIVLVTIQPGWIAAAEPASPAPTALFTEKKVLLSRPPEDTAMLLESATANPDMTYVAYVAGKEDGMQVVVNNKSEKFYDHIAKGYPVISDKGHQVGYIADKDGKYYVVVGEKEYPGYEGACGLTLSPDGNHFAYIAQEGDRQFVVRDGRAQKKYEAIDRIIGVIFSANSRHLAYVARNDDGSVVLVSDGRESDSYEAIKKVVFSPDGNHLACLATRQKKYFALRDGEAIGPYDMVDSPIWSPDSTHLAFIAIKEGKWLTIKDNQELPAGDYDVLLETITFKPPWYFEGTPESYGYQPQLPKTLPPRFSPDSSRLIWAINKNGKYRITVDGKKGPLFDAISEPVFSPDSQRFAYIGKIQNAYMNKEVMVIDGNLSQTYDLVGKPVFSPNSQHLAYRAMKDDKWFIVRDGREMPSYDAVLDPIFSNNSEHIAYAAASKKVKFVIFDDQPSNPYKYISRIFFSPQHDHLIYIAGAPTKNFRKDFFVVGDDHQEGTLHFSSHIGETAAKERLNVPQENIIFISPSHARTIIADIEDELFTIYQLDVHFKSGKDRP